MPCPSHSIIGDSRKDEFTQDLEGLFLKKQSLETQLREVNDTIDLFTKD